MEVKSGDQQCCGIFISPDIILEHGTVRADQHARSVHAVGQGQSLAPAEHDMLVPAHLT